MTQLFAIDTLLQTLRLEACRRRISNRKLAVMADLHPNTLAGFKKPGWAPSVATIRGLERVLLPDIAHATSL
jgi:hypothetical protein